MATPFSMVRIHIGNVRVNTPLLSFRTHVEIHHVNGSVRILAGPVQVNSFSPFQVPFHFISFQNPIISYHNTWHRLPIYHHPSNPPTNITPRSKKEKKRMKKRASTQRASSHAAPASYDRLQSVSSASATSGPEWRRAASSGGGCGTVRRVYLYISANHSHTHTLPKKVQKKKKEKDRQRR